MTERPILFSGPMVRAILAGTKTQTRRVMKIDLHGLDEQRIREIFGMRCPYGIPGDRLWVREAFRFLDAFDRYSPSTVEQLCLAADYPKPWAPTRYEVDGGLDNWENVGVVPGSVTPGKLRPGIHMPRWASRILLEIIGIRVERLNDISENDAVTEGCWDEQSMEAAEKATGRATHQIHPSLVYRLLWESINGPGSWEENPWVWVVEFKRVTP